MQNEPLNPSWTDHVYGLGLTQRGNTYQHWDLLGSLFATSDGQGNQTAGPVFDAFGCTIAGNPSEYGWNGEHLYRHEANTGGLRQVGVRSYDPEIGRFLQKDPAFSAPVYSYCWNDPVSLADFDGLIPHGKFSSPDGAAKAAIRAIWDQSMSDRVEYGGYIYKNPDGTYSYGDAFKGTYNEVKLPSKNKIPTDLTVVATYHTHPPPVWRMSERPSNADVIQAALSGHPGYLGTPGGLIVKYGQGVGTKDKTIARVKVN